MDTFYIRAGSSTKLSCLFFQLKGILLDSLTQEGEPYATIRVARKSAPNKPVKMMVSDMKGRFQENVKGTGSFIMTITSVGRNPIVKDFSVKAGQKWWIWYVICH